MENQRQIKAMNAIKELAGAVRVLVEELEQEPGLDQQWVAVGNIHLQLGFMALTRSVVKSTTF